MYWYLSFLRAPPVSLVVSPSNAPSINITPQVANDLRTEVKETPTSISYVWQRTAPTFSLPLAPMKLTTYTPPASTYKQLSVPLPSRAKAGERWRLGLVESHAAHRTDLESLAGSSVGVLSVWSEPIELLRANGSGKPSNAKNAAGGKQGRITRDWSLGAARGVVEIVEQTSFDLDKKLWDSGLALSALLSTWLFPSSDAKQLAQTEAMWTRRVLGRLLPTEALPRRRHVEIGTGTGVVTVALAALLHSHLGSRAKRLEEEEDMQEQTDPFNVSIVCTDLPSAIPLIEENLELNEGLWRPVDGTESVIRASSAVLDWDEHLPDVFNAETIDMVIAADVTYNTAAFPSLLTTLTSLLTLREGQDQGPLLLLAYKERDSAERELWELLKARGVWMEKIGAVEGADTGYGETEIWVGGMGDKEAL